MTAGESLGHYTLQRFLGGGGMGEVWIARDTRAARLVALKLIRPHLANEPMFRQRFLNEARTLGQLEHERIVPLYAVLDEQGRLGLALRYIDGRSLEQRLSPGEPLPLDDALRYAGDLFGALGYAHAHGVVHRDLKPANILIDGEDRAFLADFGIAVSEVIERGTLTGQAIGTPRYMSPEQIRSSRDVTARSDIYSAGIVLFEMLCGRVPFGHDAGRDDVYRVLHAHCTEPPPSLRALNPAVPQAVEDAVLACLAKDPAMRPATCEEVLAALSPATAAAQRRPMAPTPRRELDRPAGAGETVVGEFGAQPRRPLPRAAWLTAGALAIAVSVGYLLFSPGNEPGVGRPPAPVTPEGGAAQVDAPGPSVSDGRSAPAGGAPKPAEVVRPGPPAGLRPQPVAQPADDNRFQRPDSQVDRGRELFAAAKSKFEAGEYCAALDSLDKAIAMEPANISYRRVRVDYADGCTTMNAR